MIKWIDKNIKYIFIFPTLIFVLVCITYPLLYTFQLSFNEWKMSAQKEKVFVGLENYADLFSDTRFWDALWLTLYFTVISVGIATLLGVTIALLLSKVKKGTNVIRTIFLLPMVATPVAIAMIWKLIYDPTIGLANIILKALGLPPSNWLGSPDTVVSSLLIVDIWQWTPMIVLIVLAGISGLDDEIFEAARVDGANEWQTIRKITLPMLMPTILMALMLRMIDCLKTFDLIYATTLGGPGYASTNLNILTYRTAFEYFQMGKASALLIIFFALVLGFSVLFTLFRKRIERRYM